MNVDELSVDLKDFNASMRVFKADSKPKDAARSKHTTAAMLAFSNGFLTIECNDRTAVMHAVGKWHGKAEFSKNIVSALSFSPSVSNPVIIRYSGGKLTIDTIKTSCKWVPSSHGILEKISNPSLLDIFAMWRTQPVDELRREGIDKQYKLGHKKMMRATESASRKLSEFDISQDELVKLIEAKIQAKIDDYE